MPRAHALSVPAHALDDTDLVVALKEGDEAAFTTLYERYFDRIYNFSFSRMRNRADAEEVAQETFISVFRSIDAFGGRSSLLSWIYGIAKNTVNNHLRRSRAQDLRIERAEDELVRNAHSLDSCTPEEHLSFRRCADAALRSLSGVKDWQAEVFEMRHFDNLPIDEIADRVHRSNDAVRSSLYRVKRLVVEAVGDEYTPN